MLRKSKEMYHTFTVRVEMGRPVTREQARKILDAMLDGGFLIAEEMDAAYEQAKIINVAQPVFRRAA